MRLRQLGIGSRMQRTAFQGMDGVLAFDCSWRYYVRPAVELRHSLMPPRVCTHFKQENHTVTVDCCYADSWVSKFHKEFRQAKFAGGRGLLNLAFDISPFQFHIPTSFFYFSRSGTGNDDLAVPTEAFCSPTASGAITRSLAFYLAV